MGHPRRNFHPQVAVLQVDANGELTVRLAGSAVDDGVGDQLGHTEDRVVGHRRPSNMADDWRAFTAAIKAGEFDICCRVDSICPGRALCSVSQRRPARTPGTAMLAAACG
jgi:hypothetical protein